MSMIKLLILVMLVHTSLGSLKCASPTTREACVSHGCEWNAGQCNSPSKPKPDNSLCHAVTLGARLDCLQFDQTSCEKVGCCWNPTDINLVPWCYRPRSIGYSVSSVISTSPLSLSLEVGSSVSPFGNDVKTIQVDITEETSSRFHMKITDPSFPRYEIKNIINSDSVHYNDKEESLFNVAYTESPFGVSITRKGQNVPLFNSTPSVDSNGNLFSGLIYSNQYLELSTHLPDSDPVLYGLGEHVGPLKADSSGPLGAIFTLFSRDRAALQGSFQSKRGGGNLYGPHPFYMYRETGTGNYHGVLMFNSNGMDILLQPKSLTWRIIGGVIDLYIFLGPTPSDVMRQYTELIGLPYLHPRWSLGYHMCKWGYSNLSDVESVSDGMESYGIPQDTQWADIDYMDRYLDFTTDPVKFPEVEMRQFILSLDTKKKHFMNIHDPGISIDLVPTGSKNYKAREDGLNMGIFIKSNVTSKPLIGTVWPGHTYFPDFLHSNIYQYWFNVVSDFWYRVPISGMWIDMNEYSNFCDGECPPSSNDDFENMNNNRIEFNVPDMQEPLDLRNPPYVPGEMNGNNDLWEKTISLDAISGDTYVYNNHPLAAYWQLVHSTKVMETLRGQRALVVSRTTFVGGGSHGAHWLGDNDSNWDDLKNSISGMIRHGLFGFPMIGADICGFNSNTTRELCIRWTQLGSLYPFARNHNSVGNAPQEPWRFGIDAVENAKSVLLVRNSLLPYHYSLHVEAALNGSPIFRGMFFEFPNDSETAAMDEQFMFGPSLLASPVLFEGKTSVTTYLPSSSPFYDYYTGEAAPQSGYVTLNVPLLSPLSLHIRGGSVIVTQDPETTTAATTLNNYHVIIALDNNGSASGRLYLDDGVSLNTLESKSYSLVDFNVGNNCIKSDISISNYIGEGVTRPDGDKQLIKSFRISGITSDPLIVFLSLNGSTYLPVISNWDKQLNILTIQDVDIYILDSFTLTWNNLLQ